jgi:hypothetical protein
VAEIGQRYAEVEVVAKSPGCPRNSTSESQGSSRVRCTGISRNCGWMRPTWNHAKSAKWTTERWWYRKESTARAATKCWGPCAADRSRLVAVSFALWTGLKAERVRLVVSAPMKDWRRRSTRSGKRLATVSDALHAQRSWSCASAPTTDGRCGHRARLRSG